MTKEALAPLEKIGLQKSTISRLAANLARDLLREQGPEHDEVLEGWLGHVEAECVSPARRCWPSVRLRTVAGDRRRLIGL